MNINVLALADAANVRDSLLSALSAGITHLQPSAYPVPLEAQLAVQVIGGSGETGAHQFEVTIRNVVSGASLMEGSLTLQVGETQENGSSYRSFPLVLDLSQTVLPEPGDYEIQATIDGGDARTIGFTAAAVASPES